MSLGGRVRVAIAKNRSVESDAGGENRARRSRVSPPASLPVTLILTVGLAGLIVAWLVANLVAGWVGFAALVPVGLRGGAEAASALTRLFAALVLALFAANGEGRRLNWVACGFVVFGVGELVFGYLEPTLEGDTTSTAADLNESLYEMIFVRTLAGALFVIGLVPKEAPRFSLRTAVGVFLLGASGVACLLGYEYLEGPRILPPLVIGINSLEEAFLLRIAPMSWLTGWHWALAALPFGLAVAATIGALWRNRRGEVGGWLPLSIVLLAGSELHDAMWPSAYGSPVLMSTADLLRLGMAAVVAVGGALELGRVASERATLLAAEKERARRMDELAVLKADFTAMIAHELGHPLSAVRRLTEMLSRDGLDPGLRAYAIATIARETNALDALVADVQSAADIERDGFGADLRPVPLGALLSDAAAFAETLPGDHPLETTLERIEEDEEVLADPERIGQVLRNLLSNSAKHSPEAKGIRLHAVPGRDPKRVRVEVADEGPGIHPDDLSRIFEKFGRGRDGNGGQVSGVGLGLYLSRRIARAHGSELTVSTSPGAGSVFAFELEVVRGRDGDGGRREP